MSWEETRKRLHASGAELYDLIAYGTLRAYQLGNGRRATLVTREECDRSPQQPMCFNMGEVYAVEKFLKPIADFAILRTSGAPFTSSTQALLWTQRKVREQWRVYLTTLGRELPEIELTDDVAPALKLLDGEFDMTAEERAALNSSPALDALARAPERLSLEAKCQMATELIASWSGPDREDVAHVSRMAFEQVEDLERRFLEGPSTPAPAPKPARDVYATGLDMRRVHELVNDPPFAPAPDARTASAGR